MISLFDSGTIAKTVLPVTERENQGDSKEKIEKEKEDQIIAKSVSWSFSNLYFVGMLVDDHSLHSENHSKTETPPPNSGR